MLDFSGKEERRRTKRLFDEMAKAFVTAVEKRDPYANGHSLRVAALAKKLAGEAGGSDMVCEEAYYGALLHGVGAAGLSDEEEKKTARRTTTSSGVTIIDERAEQKAERKIFDSGEGEYVEYEEVQG